MRLPVAAALLLAGAWLAFAPIREQEVKVLVVIVAIAGAALLLWQRQIWLRRKMGRISETSGIFLLPAFTRTWTFKDFDRVLVETAVEQTKDGQRDRYDVWLAGRTRLALGSVVEDEEAGLRRGAAVAALTGLPLVRVEYGEAKTIPAERVRDIVEQARAAAAERPMQFAALIGLAAANLLPIAGVLLAAWTAQAVLALLALELSVAAVLVALYVMTADLDGPPWAAVIVGLMIGGGACYATFHALDLAISTFQSAVGVEPPISSALFVWRALAANGVWIAAIALVAAQVLGFMGWLRGERPVEQLRPMIFVVGARYIATLIAAGALGILAGTALSADPRIGVAVILAVRALAEAFIYVQVSAPELLRGDRALLRAASQTWTP